MLSDFLSSGAQTEKLACCSHLKEVGNVTSRALCSKRKEKKAYTYFESLQIK